MSQLQPPDSSFHSSDPNPEEGQPFTVTMPDDPASGRDWYLWAAVLALIALVAFWPAISGTFLWDDEQYVTQNNALLDASGLAHIWKIPPGVIQYYPLTFTALWIEHHFWDNSALGYRVADLIAHALAAVMLWRILRRLSIPGAWVAAAVWAIHPLQAESVCWISECKNILSGLLALGSTLFYLEWAGIRDPDSNGKEIWNLEKDWYLYAISIGLFLLAMLSKTAVCFLPVVLLLILWWKRRANSRSILGLIPMLVIAAPLAWLTSHLETNPNGPIGASGPQWQLSLAQRFLICGRDLWFYAGKLVAPIHQSFVYPRYVPNPANAADWLPLIAATAVIAILALAVRKWGRGALTAVLCYIAALFPALGFFNAFPFRYSFVADHFQYLAGIPLIVLGICIIARILQPLWKATTAAASDQRPAGKSAAIAVLASALLLALGIGSWCRASIFADPVSLWQDVLSPGKNPQSWLAAYNLSILRHGEADTSFNDAAGYLAAHQADLSDQSGHDALAALDESDRLAQAAVDNPAAPDDVRYKAYDQLAENDIMRMRSPDSNGPHLLQHAAAQLRHALSFPAAKSDPLPYYTSGIVDVNRAQQLQKLMPPEKPSLPTAPLKIGKPAAAATATTRPATAQERPLVDLYKQARDDFERASELSQSELNSLRIGPEARRVLPLAALERGNVDWELAAFAHSHHDLTSEKLYSQDAASDYNLAVQYKPDDVGARYHLALALENLGDYVAAKDNLLVILRDEDHYYAPAYNEIGRVIMKEGPTTMDEFNAAVESFKAALRLDPSMTDAQRNLKLAATMLATSRPVSSSTTEPATKP